MVSTESVLEFLPRDGFRILVSVAVDVPLSRLFSSSPMFSLRLSLPVAAMWVPLVFSFLPSPNPLLLFELNLHAHFNSSEPTCNQADSLLGDIAKRKPSTPPSRQDQIAKESGREKRKLSPIFPPLSLFLANQLESPSSLFKTQIKHLAEPPCTVLHSKPLSPSSFPH